MGTGVHDNSAANAAKYQQPISIAATPAQLPAMPVVVPAATRASPVSGLNWV